MKLILTLFLLVFTKSAFSHSGGTDSRGCHSGSVPYHCHGEDSSGSSFKFAAWDVSLGYQYYRYGWDISPYFGASLGKDHIDKKANLGVELGGMSASGMYFGYVSTSKSMQLGKGSLHISVNSKYIGLGLKFGFGNKRVSENSLFYYGSSVFFDG